MAALRSLAAVCVAEITTTKRGFGDSFGWNRLVDMRLEIDSLSVSWKDVSAGGSGDLGK